ncbi:MAG: hypothetical protein ACO20H_06820 [Bacteriovoracaceae bacterium]
MIPDNQLLSQFIKKCEKYFKHIPYSKRLTIYEEIKSDLLKERDQGKDLQEVISQYKDMQAFSNSYLKNAGQVLYERKLDWGKIIVVTFIMFILAFLVGLYFFFKSFFPLFEINDSTGSVKFFGGRIDLDDQDFNTKIYINGKEVTRKDILEANREGPNVKGSLEKEYVSSLNLSGQEFDLDIEGGNFEELTYECFSASVNEDFLKSEKGSISLNFKEPVYCDVKIPHEIDLNIKAARGNFKITNLTQNFSVYMETGDVFWKQDLKELYGLSTNYPIKLDLSWKSKNSIYSGEVEIEKGVFKVE